MRSLKPIIVAFSAASALLTASVAEAKPHHHGAQHHATRAEHGHGHHHGHTKTNKAHKHHHGRRAPKHKKPLYVNPNAPESYVVFEIPQDGSSNALILAASNLSQPMYAASTTKAMTLYLVIVALERGWITENDMVTISPHAASIDYTKEEPVFGVGQKSVGELIRLMMVLSNNRAATALAEHLARFAPQYQELLAEQVKLLEEDHKADEADNPPADGENLAWKKYIDDFKRAIASLPNRTYTVPPDPDCARTAPDCINEIIFARTMTAWANIVFDMQDTTYTNASGMIYRDFFGKPKPGNQMTAVDQAKLSYQIAKLPPKFRSFYMIPSVHYKYGPREDWDNHNKYFFDHFPGACGGKTGYTKEGFNVLDIACDEKGKPIISGVIFGYKSHANRDGEVIGRMTAGKQALKDGTALRRPDDASDDDNDNYTLKVGDSINMPRPYLPETSPNTAEDALKFTSTSWRPRSLRVTSNYTGSVSKPAPPPAPQ